MNRLIKILMSLALMAISSLGFSCGDICGWNGIYNTMGNTGYDFGSTMYDISTMTSTSISYDIYTGGCGSFIQTCGSYTPSVCGGGCGSFSGYGSGVDYNPSTSTNFYGFNPTFQDPLQDTMMNPATFTGFGNTIPPFFTTPTTPNIPIPPMISLPPTTSIPWGGCDNIVVMCPAGPITRPPTIPPIGINPPPYYPPFTPNIPTINPITPPTTFPITPVVTNPTVPVSPPTPISPPTVTGIPQYQTVPTAPNRFQIPRETH